MSGLANIRKWGVAEVILAVSILILVVVVAIPVLLIFWTSFFVNGSLNARDIMDILRQRDTYEALKNSLIIACGATQWQAMRHVVIPLVRPGMVAAFFLIFLPALRELTTSVLLYGPTTRTIGVAIYTLNEDGETVYAAALSSIALVIIILGQLLIKRIGSARADGA